MCRECDELRLGVPGLCHGEAGDGAGKRCKWLIIKPLEPAITAENPRVGGSIPPLAISLTDYRVGHVDLAAVVVKCGCEFRGEFSETPVDLLAPSA